MVSAHLSTRLPDDLYREFEEFRKSRNMTASAASRMLIADGLLVADESDSPPTHGDQNGCNELSVVQSDSSTPRSDDLRTLADLLDWYGYDPNQVTN